MILRHALAFAACAATVNAFQGATLATKPRRTVPLRSSTADATTGLADTQLVLKFACFGFKDRDCLLTLGSGGTATFSAGMVSDGPGEWRVVAGDPEDGENPRDAYLEFSQPVTEVYSELYNVPSGVVFWRGRVANEGGRLAIVDGVAISESSDTSRKLVAKLTGGAGFQRRAILPLERWRRATTRPRCRSRSRSSCTTTAARRSRRASTPSSGSSASASASARPGRRRRRGSGRNS